jgi:hypothetical protein
MADSVTRVPVKQEDFLDSDPPIRGQNYVCMSFVSPEQVILQKEVWQLNKFLEFYSRDVKDLFTNLKEKFKDDNDTVDMFVNLEARYDFVFDAGRLQDEFSQFKADNSNKLETEYNQSNSYQTSVRGIKVRGVYESLEEARKRAMLLKDLDGKFDIYIGEVGCWCPWCPNPTEVADQEYSETELNTLVKKYKENLVKKELYHKQRSEMMIAKAIEQKDVWLKNKADTEVEPTETKDT